MRAAILRAYGEPLTTEDVTITRALIACMPAVIPAANSAIIEIAGLGRIDLDPV